MRKLLLLLPLALLISCSQSQLKLSERAILISDINIVDVQDGSVAKAMQVVIDSGKIVAIKADIENPEAFLNRIDGSGKYLLPGLAEMHAHIPSPPTSDKRIEETLFLYLSNGVTTIRGMLGHPSLLVLRNKAANKEILSPRIFTSSPSLNGFTVKTKEEAIARVTEYASLNYDFLKIHPGIKRDVFDQLVTTANEAGIGFAGHVPVEVGIRHALESGFQTIDHVDGYLEGLVPEDANVALNANGFFGFDFTELADTSKIPELVDMTQENEVWIVPTQSLFERWFAPTEAKDMLSQPEMKYMPVATLMEWQKRKIQSTGPDSDFDPAQWETFIGIRRQLIKALSEGGHGMLLGSDAPQLFNVPGFSIHHEIEAMSKAGMTPLEILQSGTVNPARFFGMEEVFGQVKEGLAADLLLVNGNPLEDLEALREPYGVLVAGQWLPRELIDARLEDIAYHASILTPQ